jgi:hypothetical protein
MTRRRGRPPFQMPRNPMVPAQRMVWGAAGLMVGMAGLTMAAGTVGMLRGMFPPP